MRSSIRTDESRGGRCSLRQTRLAATLFSLFLSACISGDKAPDEPLVFYPLPPDPPRVQFLRSISLESDIGKPPSSLDSLIFGDVKQHRGVMAPYGVAVRDGIIYVCDIQQSVVLTMDIPGKEMGHVQLKGRGLLQKPVNLDFAPDGTMYVADVGRRQIVVISPEREYVTEFGPFSEQARPTSVVVHGDELYLSDAGDRLVRVLNRETGEELRTYGSGDNGGPVPRAPTNVVVDQDGKVYAVDSVDCLVYVWEPDGTYSGTIGAPGDIVGQFARPKGIALHDDMVFVVDAAFENCQIFDKQGEPMMFFGGTGVGPGDLYLPAGVWVGENGLDLFADLIDEDFEAQSLIIVTSQFGPRKVNFYALGDSRTLGSQAGGTQPEGP